MSGERTFWIQFVMVLKMWLFRILLSLRLLKDVNYANSLCKFIAEVRKVKGGEYPPQMVHALIIAIQIYLKTCRINWKLLSEDDEVFIDLYNVVDNVMKERTEMGLGKVNSADPVTNAMENEMWKNGVLGGHTPSQLLDTVMYLIRVNCALQGGGGG